MMWDNGDGRWQMHDNGAGWLMVILMLVFVVAVVVVIFALLRGTTPLTASANPPAMPRGPDARAILRERFARGEIDEQDFRSRMRALDEEGPNGG
jgi:putative membrane protein